MKRKSGSSNTESIDENRRRVIRDGLVLAGVTFTGFLPGCGAPEGGSSENRGTVDNIEEDDDGNGGNGGGITNAGAVDVRFETVRFKLSNTSIPGTQSVNLSPGFGIPKGIIMIQTSDRFGGTGYNNSSFCIGFSDGINEVCVHAQHDSEATPGQKCFRTMWNGQCSVRVQSTTNDGVVNAVSVNSFNTDQVVLSIDDGRLNGEEFECILIAIGGDDVDSVIAGFHDDLGTTSIGVPVPIGHASDMIFTLTDHDSSFDFKGKNSRSADNGASISYGVAINDGSQTQMCAAWSSPNAPSSNPAMNTVGLYNDSIIASLADGATENYSVSLTSFDSNGVTMTPSANALNCIFGYLSIKFAKTVNMKIVDTTIPTSGDISVSGVGFRPGFGMWLNFAGAASYNNPADASYSLATTIFDGSNMYSHMNNGVDGISNSDTTAWGRAGSGFEMMNAGGSKAIGVEASGYTFTNDGVDLTMTNWPANQTLGRMLLLGVN